MKAKIKNQVLPALKIAVGNYFTLEYKSEIRYKNEDDYSIDIYQLEGGKRTDTIHPIEQICKVAEVFKISAYVTKVYGEDYLKVHLF